MLARQRTAAGGHNLCMKSLAKAYMDLEREYVVIQRRKQDLTLILYHIENFRVHGVKKSLKKSHLSLRAKRATFTF